MKFDQSTIKTLIAEHKQSLEKYGEWNDLPIINNGNDEEKFCKFFV